MILSNFHIVYKNGRIFYSKNFKGLELDQSLVLAFSSSISNFTKTLLNQPVRELTSQSSRILYQEFGDFIMVAHCDFSVASSAVQSLVRDLGSVCEVLLPSYLQFLFGSCEFWEPDFFDLNGGDDLVSYFFSANPTDHMDDPRIHMAGGITRVSLDTSTSDRLDKLLGHLEGDTGVSGGGTMLILGKACLASRFSLHETRMILHYHCIRPMGENLVKYTPVFTAGVWQNLYMIKMQGFVLVVLVHISTTYDQLEPRLNAFRMSFMQSRLEIPTEVGQIDNRQPPTMLIRMFAKRETFAMLYHNIKTGNTMFPQLRPCPEVQQREILSNFWTLYADATAALKAPGVCECSVSKDAYKFYARAKGVHKIFLLLAADAGPPEQVANEVLVNVKTYDC